MNRSFSGRLAAAAAILVAFFIVAQECRAAPAAFAVAVTGKGNPIIFIPGLASSGEVWQSTVAQFCGDRECHVLTLAGFAGVQPIEAPLLPTVAKQLVEYIDAKKLDQPVLVGHSLGGFLALRLAADYPDKVGKLVIVDSLPALGATQMPDSTPQQLRSMADRMRDSMRKQDGETFTAAQRTAAGAMVTNPEDVERVIGWGRKSDKKTVIDAMYDMMSTDLRQDIARIKAPTLVLGSWAAYKSFAPRSVIEDTFKSQYQKLKNVTIVLSDTGRHFLMYDDPQWMFAKMKAFLR